MKLFLLTAIVVFSGLGCARGSNDMKHAKRYGADARIVLRCVDQNGIVVTNATVSSALYPDGSFKNAIVKNGTTNTNGCFVMEGKTNGEFSFTVKKKECYETSEDKYLFKDPAVFVSNGRWQPYGATNTVVLKRIMNPVPMYVKPYRNEIVPAQEDTYLGFDFEKGDWVKPHGTGEVTDLVMRYEYKAGAVPPLYYYASVSLAFTNLHDGACVVKKDEFSSFVSTYTANTNAVYQNELTFTYDRFSGEKKKDTKLDESSYLILRTRSKTNEYGKLLSANYEKIYEPISAGSGGIYMGYYFNPNENDTNLEADTNKNLLNSKIKGFKP